MNIYRPSECASFRKITDKWGGLSNMADFPLRVNGVRINTTEALYQALRFPHMPDVQKVIIDQASPMAAKMKSKPHRAGSRPDWEDVKVDIMRWCLRVKLASHTAKWGALLLSTGNKPIVEESHRDSFWGAVEDDDGMLVGENVLGTLLTELRDQHRTSPSSTNIASTAGMTDMVLLGKPIADVVRAKLL